MNAYIHILTCTPTLFRDNFLLFLYLFLHCFLCTLFIHPVRPPSCLYFRLYSTSFPFHYFAYPSSTHTHTHTHHQPSHKNQRRDFKIKYKVLAKDIFFLCCAEKSAEGKINKPVKKKVRKKRKG